MRGHRKCQFIKFLLHQCVHSRDYKDIQTLYKVFNAAPSRDLCISQQMVEHTSSKLKKNKSSGPDGVHSWRAIKYSQCLEKVRQIFCKSRNGRRAGVTAIEGLCSNIYIYIYIYIYISWIKSRHIRHLTLMYTCA